MAVPIAWRFLIALAVMAALTPVAKAADPPRWTPAVGLTWQWQLSGQLDSSVNVDVYDLDGFETTAAQVQALHDQGRKVICYISAGSWENFRADKSQFPAADIGRRLDGWPGERWLDIRDTAGVLPIMHARMQMCKDKGFDAVELDNVDGYANNTGFQLTAQDQLAYNRALAQDAHALGLAVALKNDLEQVLDLLADFDLAINEQCFQYHECGALKPFIAAGKPVLNVEYELGKSQFCAKANRLQFSSMRKRLSLDAWRRPCAQ